MQTVSTSWILPRVLIKLLKPSRDALPAEPLRCEFDRWPIALMKRHQAWCGLFIEHPRAVASFAYLPLQHAQVATMLHSGFGPSMLGLVHVRQQLVGQPLPQWTHGRFIIDSHWHARKRQQGRGIWLDCEQTMVDVATGHILYAANSRYLSRHPWAGPLPIDATPVVELGDTHQFQPICQFTLQLRHGRAYAQLSGDWNPIHLSLATARLFGQSHALVHGAALVSLVEQVVPHSPPGCDVRFLKPVRYNLPIDIGRVHTNTYQVRQAGIVCLTWQVQPSHPALQRELT